LSTHTPAPPSSVSVTGNDHVPHTVLPIQNKPSRPRYACPQRAQPVYLADAERFADLADPSVLVHSYADIVTFFDPEELPFRESK
jgi:hypothetical protein